MLRIYETEPGTVVLSTGEKRVIISESRMYEKLHVPVLAGGFSGRGKLIHTTDKPMEVGEVYSHTEIKPIHLMILKGADAVVQYVGKTPEESSLDNYWRAMGTSRVMDNLPEGTYMILDLGTGDV